MDRGERRYQSLRVKTRRLFVLRMNMGPYGRANVAERPWQAVNEMGRWMMSSCPKAWRKVMMIRPSRSAQNQMIRNGKYEDVFPDYRKPHIYYW